MARREERENLHYRSLGEQSHDAMELLTTCQLFVLTSAMEGGANAIAEAVVCGVPVVCSDIPGNMGMLRREYGGYFPTGDTEQLVRMLFRAETAARFLNGLRESIARLQKRFSPEQELESWTELLQSL